MPNIHPEGGAVWPVGEGVIGVVGVAPWATLDFLKAVYRQVSASKDWDYPRILCDLNTKIPSRGRYLELGERDPSPFIAATIKELAEQGATLAVVPCNTAHILYDRWAAGAPIPVPNIVEVTVRRLQARGARNAAIFASRSLARHALYEHAIQRAGIEVTLLDSVDVELINDAIAQIKVAGGVMPRSIANIQRMLKRLAAEGVDALVLGCTELGALTQLAERYFPAVLDSNEALAQAAVELATKGTG